MVQKPTLSRTTRQDPAIWVPIASAREQGMRSIMTRAEVDEALKILSNREYYFSVTEPFSTVQPKLEVTIRNEGGIGLAKTLSYLFVLKRKQIVASSEVNKMHESVLRLILREISEILGETAKALEEKINRGLKHKLIPDT
jgi:RNA polymerase-interacting CarD/CdnL/TRCF family regulator